jgi:serralysin
MVVAMGQTNSLSLKGGNDAAILLTINTPPNYSVAANGGAGSDTLQFEVKFSVVNNLLDLLHPANNSGIFANSTFTGFETFRHVEADGASTATQRFTFRGDGNAQAVIGAYGIDDIRTAGGNDVLNGGLGRDILAGGVGRDIFIFNTALGPANLDQILDFYVPNDTIKLENAIFAGIGGNGVLAAVRFHTGAHAHDADDRIIYNPGTGALLYDSNGSGAGHETQFATLAKHLAPTHSDFIVI